MMPTTSLDLRRADAPIDYLERAREIAPMLAAAADEIEESRQLPERVVEALIERGFFRMLLPRSLGGAELDPLTYVQVLEEIAKADPSTAWSLGQNSGCSMTAPYLDPASPGAGALRPAAGTPPGSAPMSRSSSPTALRASTRTAAPSSAPSSSPSRAPRSSTIGRSSGCVAPAATAIGSTTFSSRRDTPPRATTKPSGASPACSTALPAA
jgi:hypothetical protein